MFQLYPNYISILGQTSYSPISFYYLNYNFEPEIGLFSVNQIRESFLSLSLIHSRKFWDLGHINQQPEI